jgi:hypothetical protein
VAIKKTFFSDRCKQRDEKEEANRMRSTERISPSLCRWQGDAGDPLKSKLGFGLAGAAGLGHGSGVCDMGQDDSLTGALQ